MNRGQAFGLTALSLGLVAYPPDAATASPAAASSGPPDASAPATTVVDRDASNAAPGLIVNTATPTLSVNNLVVNQSNPGLELTGAWNPQDDLDSFSTITITIDDPATPGESLEHYSMGIESGNLSFDPDGTWSFKQESWNRPDSTTVGTYESAVEVELTTQSQAAVIVLSDLVTTSRRYAAKTTPPDAWLMPTTLNADSGLQLEGWVNAPQSELSAFNIRIDGVEAESNVQLSEAPNGAGHYTWRADIEAGSAVEDGSYTVFIDLADVYGNVIRHTYADVLVVDNTAPAVTVTDLMTNNPEPILSGTVDDADAALTLTLEDSAGTPVREAVTVATVTNDTWTVDLATKAPGELADGRYKVILTATDRAGNTRSVTGDLAVGTGLPRVTVDTLLTNEASPTLTGTIGRPDSKLQTFEVSLVGVDTPPAAVTIDPSPNADGDYAWTATLDTALDDGLYGVAVHLADVYGNAVASTFENALMVDTMPPTEFRSSPAPAPAPTPASPAELDQTPLVELAELIRQRQDGAAVSLAMQLQRDYEGDPDYDVLLGWALMNVADYQEATFALERTLIVRPGNVNVRLTLVQAYLGLGNTQAARRQLTQLQRRTLNSNQQSRWAALDQLHEQQVQRRQRQTRLAVSTELQYYTNINTGLSVDTLTDIDIVGPDIEVDDAAKAKAAPAITVQASAERTTPLSQRTRRTSQVGLTTRHSTFTDARNLGGLLAVSWQHDRGRRAGLQVIPSWTTDGAQVTTAATGQLDDLVGPLDLALSTAWTWSDEHSLLTTVSVSDAPSLGTVPMPWRLSLLGNINTDSAGNYLGAGASLQPRWRPAALYSVQFDFGYQVQAYLEESALYNERRLDQTVRAELLMLRPWRDQGLFTGRITAQNRLSNQSLYAFRGVELAVGYQHAW